MSGRVPAGRQFVVATAAAYSGYPPEPRSDSSNICREHDRQCSLRQADRYRPREFGINESDGAPDEKERRPKHEHLITKRA
jgi:hypothetical protein